MYKAERKKIERKSDRVRVSGGEKQNTLHDKTTTESIHGKQVKCVWKKERKKNR